MMTNQYYPLAGRQAPGMANPTSIPGCSNTMPPQFNMLTEFHCPHKLNNCTKGQGYSQTVAQFPNQSVEQSFNQSFAQGFQQPVHHATHGFSGVATKHPGIAGSSIGGGMGAGGGMYDANPGKAYHHKNYIEKEGHTLGYNNSLTVMPLQPTFPRG